MELGQILTNYRLQTQDRIKPYKVPNEEAIFYFNEGQREAARRARLIVDSTTDNVAQVQVNAGDPLVPISPAIISIRRLRLRSRVVTLVKRQVRDMDFIAPGWDTSTNQSQPAVAVVDYQTDALLLYPTPKENDLLMMTVTREPLADVEADGDVPEVNGRYHLGIIEWMKFKTYISEDTDLYDEKKALSALKRFEEEFGPAIGATNERYELEHYDDVGER